jgi:hypothetical protein
VARFFQHSHWVARLACCIAGLVAAAAASGESPAKAFDNSSVIAMSRAALPESTILLAIAANDCHFDLSPAQLIELHKQNVTDVVIRAMLASAARQGPGALTAVVPSDFSHAKGSARFPVAFFAQRSVTSDGAPSDGAGTVYVGRNRLRLETAREISLIDPETMTGYAWRVGEGVRITHRFESVRGVPEGEGPSRYLLPVDPDRPCAQWLNVACRRIGADSVAGRPVTKWEMTRYFDGDGFATSYIWVDETLHAVSRLQEGGYIAELRNIVEHAQPAALFDPPGN